jgi:hypothetical protein
MNATNDHWIERLQTVGRAQARYLWLLLVTGIFYWAVQDQMEAAAPAQLPPLKLPVIDLELSGGVVWATGPAVVAFILLAYLGAVRAYSRATEALGLNIPGDPETVSEPFDTAPNAVDLAAYTTQESWAFVKRAVYFLHPLIITGFLLEAMWLAVRVGGSPQAIPGRTAWVIFGSALCLAASFRVADTWRRRIRRTVEDWRRARDPVSISEGNRPSSA